MTPRKLPECLQLNAEQVAALFPFHLLISRHRLELLSVGGALAETLPASGAAFDEWFELTRPSTAADNFDELVAQQQRLCFIKCRNRPTTLRGQFLLLQPDVLLFVGTVLVTAPDTLDNSGLSLNDFNAFDNTPELLILHRFREIQLRSIQQSNEQLRVAMEARVRSDRHANTDVLTGILNRRGFWKSAGELLVSRSAPASLMLLDLDGFKYANDEYGHEAGDDILRRVSRTLDRAVGELGVVGRLGGDEFVALVAMPELPVKLKFDNIVEQIKSELQQHPHSQSLNVSTGVVTCQPGETLEHAVRCADLAMFAARRLGAGRQYWYDEQLRDQLAREQQLTADLSLAIENHTLQPAYQPVLHLETGALAGFEVLARWQHEVYGFIGPDVFLALAEQAGKLPALDNMMLGKALDQLHIWTQQGRDYVVHVNLCGKSLTPELPDSILQHLQARDIEPERLIIELTETTLIDNPEMSVRILQQVVDLGVRVQLDDFGTGYSSLTHLQDFPVSGLKIDRSFVATADHSERARNLLTGIVDIARRLDLELVGEGIETPEQLQLLKSLGCDYGQGYLLGKPAPADSCEAGYDNELQVA